MKRNKEIKKGKKAKANAEILGNLLPKIQHKKTEKRM